MEITFQRLYPKLKDILRTQKERYLSVMVIFGYLIRFLPERIYSGIF